MTRLIEPLTYVQRLKVVAAARELLVLGPYGKAVPFRHQGRTVKGIDCIGSVVWAYSRGAGVNMVDRVDYGRGPGARKLRESLELHFGPSQPLNVPLQLADVLSMAWGEDEAHLALVVDHPHGFGIIHAYSKAGKVIEHGLHEDHLRLVTGVFR